MDRAHRTRDQRNARYMTPKAELRLDLTPEAADALLAGDPFGEEPSRLPQRTVYFDTPRNELAAAGLTLLVREMEGKRIQKMKAGGPAAGLFVRSEWERPLSDERPVFDETTPLAAMLGAKVQEIRPVFEIRGERLLWNVVQDDAGIEAVLDRGEIVAGDRRSFLCEIGLELRSGKPAALFALARRLGELAPLRPGVIGKVERGYRLLAEAPRAVKAEAVTLRSDMSADDAFQEIAASCLRHFRLNEPLLSPCNPEALHQARVALRRLRSALSIYKEMLEDSRFAHFRNELRWLAGSTGDARDLDVLAARCTEDSFRARLEAARTDAYGRAMEALGSPRARLLMLDLVEWLACGEWRTAESNASIRAQPARDFAASALDRFRRKVKKGGRDLAELDEETRHEVRKDAKKLRYAAGFFGSLFDTRRQQRRYSRFVDALEAMQDRLGTLNDLAVLPRLLERLDLVPDDVAGMVAPAGKESLLEAAEAHDAFVDAKRFWR